MQYLVKRLFVIAIIILAGFSSNAQNISYKCMVQMKSYLGEGAYIVVSLMNKDNTYNKTLYMLGADKEWYPDFKEWHKFYKKKPTNLDAITGASVSGGDRAIVTLTLDKALINAGYKIRFESAVEDKQYYTTDLELPLTTEALGAKTEGTGYISYIRFSAN